MVCATRTTHSVSLSSLHILFCNHDHNDQIFHKLSSIDCNALLDLLNGRENGFENGKCPSLKFSPNVDQNRDDM